MFFDLPDEAATLEFGAKIANSITKLTDKPMVITLSGDLGRGKTTFVKGFIKSLGYPGLVKSPTYAIVEPYANLNPPTYHFDLYRLADPSELEYIGIRDYLAAGNICIFEWPEKAKGILPQADIELAFDLKADGREVKVTINTPELLKYETIS